MYMTNRRLNNTSPSSALVEAFSFRLDLGSYIKTPPSNRYFPRSCKWDVVYPTVFSLATLGP